MEALVTSLSSSCRRCSGDSDVLSGGFVFRQGFELVCYDCSLSIESGRDY